MRMKAAIGVSFLVIVVAIIVLITVDLRHGDSLIEKPMIKIYD
jgi:hypothetical protein